MSDDGYSVVVGDYDNTYGYLVFSEENGALFVRAGEDGDANDVLLKGLGVRRERGALSFAALYVADNRLVLQLNRERLDLGDQSLSVRRRTVFPGIKQFRVTHAGRVVVDLTYRWWDFLDDGRHDSDFFLWVAKVKRNPLLMRSVHALLLSGVKRSR